MPRAGLRIKQKGCPQWQHQTAAGKCSKLEHFSDATELQCFRGYGHCSCCTGPDLLLWPARLSNSRSGESGRRVAAAGCNSGPSQTKPAQQTTGNVRNCTSLSRSPPALGLGRSYTEEEPYTFHTDYTLIDRGCHTSSYTIPITPPSPAATVTLKACGSRLPNTSPRQLD